MFKISFEFSKMWWGPCPIFSRFDGWQLRDKNWSNPADRSADRISWRLEWLGEARRTQTSPDEGWPISWRVDWFGQVRCTQTSPGEIERIRGFWSWIFQIAQKYELSNSIFWTDLETTLWSIFASKWIKNVTISNLLNGWFGGYPGQWDMRLFGKKDGSGWDLPESGVSGENHHNWDGCRGP